MLKFVTLIKGLYLSALKEFLLNRVKMRLPPTNTEEHAENDEPAVDKEAEHHDDF